MKIFRRTAGCTLLDHKRNEEILEEMKVELVHEKLSRCKSNWPQPNKNGQYQSTKNNAEL